MPRTVDGIGVSMMVLRRHGGDKSSSYSSVTENKVQISLSVITARIVEVPSRHHPDDPGCDRYHK
jgi:hypothetical protein